MRYLLDTDILSNLLKKRPSTDLIAKLGQVPAEDQATSSISFGELIYGAHRVPERRDALLRGIAERLLPNLPVLPFDREAADEYGRLRAALESEGSLIGEADMRIGSLALSRKLIVVTGNVRHFQKIPGLLVENWLE